MDWNWWEKDMVCVMLCVHLRFGSLSSMCGIDVGLFI